MVNKIATKKTNGTQMVHHKIYGSGQVVGREVKDNGTYITVMFENGKELKFGIPSSFELGLITAEGSLKEEIDAAIAEKKANKKAKLEEFIATVNVATHHAPSHRHGRTPATSVVRKGLIEKEFEEYLISAGYKEETDAGNPSTVFSYTNAIKKVLEEENISWSALQNDIDHIVPIYDVGGAKQHIGAKSNCTVINALKRFNEFVNI